MTAQPLPAWAFPPVDGFTADDLDRIPDLPPHTELIDGSLVFVSPQKSFHTLVMDVLVNGLRRSVPETLRVRREMTIVLDRHNRPEPDISVVRAEAVADEGLNETRYLVEDVVLAVEVVSPESVARDRNRKPQLYAEAGIPNFWLVEQSEVGEPIVHVYELDQVAKKYVHAGIHHKRLKICVPFTIDIDLTEIDRL
ncbi:Uma2 family endonuclease [Streptomyces sp. H10-C2]|uniref:Uma2 family endonuclease n=1 Tax=unclassified Streptomyces TaxID=2593676 RepID=UPI0024BB9A59|nr:MULTISPECIES: Uma2 family endonuclease [unclassified Streptomyces]MDJ0341395.1 Uma2 family endonuclease [Streptomyces sp. PH10-H1]MDJ0369052.1 Uma2 family endonuclease [Streptomyces sp. H10-C2]